MNLNTKLLLIIIAILSSLTAITYVKNNSYDYDNYIGKYVYISPYDGKSELLASIAKTNQGYMFKESQYRDPIGTIKIDKKLKYKEHLLSLSDDRNTLYFNNIKANRVENDYKPKKSSPEELELNFIDPMMQ